MEQETFRQQLQSLQSRMEVLLGSVSQEVASNSPLADAFEEIQVMMEELRVQNEALLQANQALEAERQRYRDLFEFAPDGYLVTDVKGTIREANRIAAYLLNIPADRLVGKPLTNFIPLEERKVFRSRLARLEEQVAIDPSSRDENWITRLTPRANEPLYVSLTVAGTPGGGLRWQVRDISELVQARQELELANRDLEQRVQDRTAAVRQAQAQTQSYAHELELKNRDLRDFAAVASHDLQEPLRKIRVFSEMLGMDKGDVLGEEGVGYLERMQKAAVRMQSMLDGLLVYSRLDSRAKPLAWTDLNEVAREALADLELQIMRLGGQVEVAPLPWIEAEPTQMRQLLQNLIGNGLKFHRPDEPPAVKVWAEKVLEAERAEPAAPEQVRIVVQDNGIGFDDSYLPRLFQPFQRLHGRNEYPGEGMGLAICRRVVERHAGTITAHSQPGQGATFIVALPVHPPAAEADGR